MRAASVLLVTLSLLPVAPAFAQLAAGAAQERPESQAFVWERPCDIVFPLDPLLEQGLLPIQCGQGADAALSLVRLADGEVLWVARVASDVAAINATADLIAVALKGRIMVLAVKDGEALWQEPFQGMLDAGWQTAPKFRQSQWFADLRTSAQGIGGVLCFTPDRLYATIAGNLYAMDAKTGKQAWSTKYGFKLDFPVIATEDLVLASANTGLTAYDPATGSVRWSLPRVHGGPLALVGDELYVAMDRVLCRVEAGSGAVAWSANIAKDPALRVFPRGGRVVVQRPGDVWLLDRNSGQVLWAAETARQNSLVAGERVFLRGKQGGDIYCLSIRDVNWAWQAPCQQLNLGRLVAAGDVVVAISGFDVVAMDAATGNVLWSKQAAAGELFETSAWAAGAKSVFFRTAKWLLGCHPRRGTWLAGVNGDFPFVHWMWTNDKAVYLHSSHPGGATVGGLTLKQEEPPAGEEGGTAEK